MRTSRRGFPRSRGDEETDARTKLLDLAEAHFGAAWLSGAPALDEVLGSPAFDGDTVQ